MKNLISVIIPIYNSDKYLSECFESIINQTYTNYEIILVNDGSTDKSKYICEDFCKKYKKFKLYNNENHGVSYSRNFGIEKANGEYICFVDSDDILDFNYFEKLKKNMSESNADLSICGIKGFKDKIIKDNHNNDTINYFDTNLADLLFGKYGGYLANKMYKRELIMKKKLILNENICICEDLIFNLEYLRHCKLVVANNDSLYYYRVHSTSSFYNYNNINWFSIIDAYNLIIQFNPNNPIVFYNYYMILLEAKYRQKKYFPKHFNLKDRIQNEIYKMSKNLKKMNIKQYVKIKIFYYFPNIVMKIKERKVGE